MKRKITILSVFMMCIVNVANVINYKTNNIEITNQKVTNQNTKFESVNFSVPDIYDVISIDTTVFNNCTVEFWFEAMSMKKKLKIGYDAWTNYFGPMIQKLDEYIFKHPVSPISAGQIKIGLINMFSEVIKHNFWRGGNDVDRNSPYWDGYQIAASYMIKNKEYLNTFFKEKGIDSIFETEYWTNYYFLDKQQLEALESDSVEKVFISDIEKFTVPTWFPILKNEIWDIDQHLFYYDKTKISVAKLINDKILVEFKFADETIENLKKGLDKYSALDKISNFSGIIALSFCTMLKQKILNNFEIDETIAMQFATYIYKYRDEVETWRSFKGIYIEKDFYWFEDDMEGIYERNNKSFKPFELLREWPM